MGDDEAGACIWHGMACKVVWYDTPEGKERDGSKDMETAHIVD